MKKFKIEIASHIGRYIDNILSAPDNIDPDQVAEVIKYIYANEKLKELILNDRNYHSVTIYSKIEKLNDYLIKGFKTSNIFLSELNLNSICRLIAKLYTKREIDKAIEKNTYNKTEESKTEEEKFWDRINEWQAQRQKEKENQKGETLVSNRGAKMTIPTSWTGASKEVEKRNTKLYYVDPITGRTKESNRDRFKEFLDSIKEDDKTIGSDMLESIQKRQDQIQSTRFDLLEIVSDINKQLYALDRLLNDYSLSDQQRKKYQFFEQILLERLNMFMDQLFSLDREYEYLSK